MLVRSFRGYILPPESFAKLEPIYRSLAPGLNAYGKWPEDVAWVDPIASSPDFVVRPTKEYVRDEVFSASRWTGFLSTASDHRRQPPEVLTELLEAVGEALGPEILRAGAHDSALRREGPSDRAGSLRAKHPQARRVLSTTEPGRSSASKGGRRTTSASRALAMSVGRPLLALVDLDGAEGGIEEPDVGDARRRVERQLEGAVVRRRCSGKGPPRTTPGRCGGDCRRAAPGAGRRASPRGRARRVGRPGSAPRTRAGSTSRALSNRWSKRPSSVLAVGRACGRAPRRVATSS